MKVYLSGPMTGLPDFNRPAFVDAERLLSCYGVDVLNPARHGFDPAKTWADYMRLALLDVAACDAVALLPGWERSRGAQLEVHVASSLGIPVQDLRVHVADLRREARQ